VKIKITATRRDNQVPAIFEVINIHFDLFGELSIPKVERALDLTFEKYCSVSNIIGRSAEIRFSYQIHS
jgi:putative redox protein